MSRRPSQHQPQPRHSAGPADAHAHAHAAGFAGSMPVPEAQASHLWTARETAVLRSRQGSVLTRGLILKADHFAGARRPHLDLHLQGAPNFRKADVPVEVYGCAQPTVTGLKGVLSVLQCRPIRQPRTSKGRERVNSGRPGASPRLAPGSLPDGNEGAKTPVLGSSPPKSWESHSLDEAMASFGSSPPAESGFAGARRPSGTPLGAAFDSMAPPRKCVWFCTREEPVVYISNRPFVLRESDRPIDNFEISDRAENLESIESRLKQDLLREAARYDGLLMVHEEDENGDLMPSWVAVDTESVSTVREVFTRARSEGWAVDYHRVPIAANQSIENNYLDAYTRILKELDPTKTSVVANCGIGAVRTTVAMIAAVIVRRRQMIVSGYDPLRLSQTMQETAHAAAAAAGRANAAAGNSELASPRRGSTPNEGVARSLRAASEQQQQAQTLLRLMRVLNNSVSGASVDSQNVLERLLSNPTLLDALRGAYRGDYGIVRQLCGLLDEGLESKAVADLAIDSCSAVVHLREMVLSERVAYAVSKHDAPSTTHDATHGDTASAHLGRAVRTLEQYSSLVVFAEYVGGSATAAFQHRFSSYLKEREEIWRTLLRIRTKGSQLYLFAPIEDLSALSSEASVLSARGQIMGGAARSIGTLDRTQPGDEVADHLIRHRAGVVLRPGMLLKQDVWRKFIEKNASEAVRGAVNVRRVPGTNIWVTGQPTKEGIIGLVRKVAEQVPHDGSTPLIVTWLNLREEPLVLVGGKPVVLRQKGSSLRNVREFMGISWERLTLLEDRLKADCIAELEGGEGKLLLHAETDEGEVVPRWEDTQTGDIQTLQETMEDTVRALELGASPGKPASRRIELAYRRIPITAERAPDFADFDLLTRTVIKADVERGAIILNDQLGRGRGTLTAVIVVLITRWLNRSKAKRGRPDATPDVTPVKLADGTAALQREPLSYHAVNALLRIVPHGREVKATVDSAIDQCAAVINLRDIIEDARLAAEGTDDEGDRRAKIQTALQHLRRYYELCVFQAYLDATRPDTLEGLPSFESFIKRQPVLDTLSHEFDKVDMATITPLQKLEPDGMALNEEVQEVVAKRNGSVLTAYTMLKSDMFPGLAKISLSQIEGIPNLRGVSLVLGAQAGAAPLPSTVADLKAWGHGMPSTAGIRRGLEYMGAGPDGSATVVASSMREEPVLFVNGRPHVLRLADQPLTNVEATGITTDVVESMERSLKNDVLKEIRKYNGRLLLHDELELSGGRYEIVPQWFTVKDEDVLTPREVYEAIQREGYHVDYARIPVTDEQAPVPAVFSELEERVMLALRTGASTVQNCQMGRGRTTCALVISLLVGTIAHRAEELLVSDMSASFISAAGSDATAATDDSDGVIDGAKDAMDNREDQLWLAGEYRSIIQLVGVLAHGKLAKKLTDRAIDACDQVQNLRTAIYDARLRANNAEPGSKKNQHLTRVYANYLQRYGYLIVFTSYLLEKAQAGLEGGAFDDVEDSRSVASSTLTTGRFPSFAAYLKPRREIQVIMSQKPQ